MQNNKYSKYFRDGEGRCAARSANEGGGGGDYSCYSINLGKENPRVIPKGAIWKQVLLGADMPRTQGPIPLTPTVFPNEANFGVLGEGVSVTTDGVVWMIDISPLSILNTQTLPPTTNPAGILWRYDPKTQIVTNFLQPSDGANGTHPYKDGLLVCCRDKLKLFNTQTAAFTVLAADYPAGSGNTFVGLNDVTVSPEGRIYFTDANFSGNLSPFVPNAVYRIDLDGSLHRIITNLSLPNGIEVSPDGKYLYVLVFNNIAGSNLTSPLAEQGYDAWGYSLRNTAPPKGIVSGGHVIKYDLNANGEIVDKNGNISPENSNVTAGRSIISRSNCGCDGCAMDTEGNLYVAWHNARHPGSTFTQGQIGEITVTDSKGNQIDNLSPELAFLPPIPSPAAPDPNHIPNVQLSGSQIANFRPYNLGFGKQETKHILYLMRSFPWGLYQIETNKQGYS